MIAGIDWGYLGAALLMVVSSSVIIAHAVSSGSIVTRIRFVDRFNPVVRFNGVRFMGSPESLYHGLAVFVWLRRFNRGHSLRWLISAVV